MIAPRDGRDDWSDVYAAAAGDDDAGFVDASALEAGTRWRKGVAEEHGAPISEQEATVGEACEAALQRIAEVDPDEWALNQGWECVEHIQAIARDTLRIVEAFNG